MRNHVGQQAHLTVAEKLAKAATTQAKQRKVSRMNTSYEFRLAALMAMSDLKG